MKNACSEILEAKIAERNERAKKLYRYVNDVARRIAEMTANSRTIADLFSTNVEVQRQKLRDNCEKLLFLDPINYGKKSLELLWRKVYYDTISTAKKLRETDLENDGYLYSHLICGIGHFHHFLSKIQSEMRVQHKELDYVPIHDDNNTLVTSEESLDEELQFGKAALHSCLIYLGDLSRYQVEIFHSFDPSIAARYYLQAAHLDTSSGMPYNQLGNLYLDRNYNIDSVCYYIQCLNCKAPFDGALGNLTKIFGKNSQYCDSVSDPLSLTQSEYIQNTVLSFLSLIEIWYLGKNDTNIPQRCNRIAHEIKSCMDFVKTPLPDINKNYDEYIQVLEEENVNPSYMNPNLIHKITLICLFTISKIVETNETKAFACKAFTLALLSQLLQKLLKQLKSFGLSNPAHKYKPRILTNPETESNKINDNVEPEEAKEPNKIPNGTHETPLENNKETDNIDQITNVETKNKKTLSKRRRRRRVASSESSDLSDAGTEGSDIETPLSSSDEDFTNSSCHSADESHSDDTECDGSDIDLEKETNNKQKTIMETESKPVNGDITNENKCKETQNVAAINNNNIKGNMLNLQALQDFLLGDNFLTSIKLLQDWVLLEKELILSCGDSGESLFQCVVDLLNIFTFYFTPKIDNVSQGDYSLLKYVRGVAKKLKLEYKTIPLPEDINLRGTNICKFDKDAAEWQILERCQLSVYEENVTRILNFIDFGNQIAKIVPRIRFNRTMKIFYLKKNFTSKLSTKINHKKTREWHNSKQLHQDTQLEGMDSAGASESGLLARLGRLWLKARVRELERGRRAAANAAPALLALDAAALHSHLRRVKQLLRTKHFILLVPTVVLHELDGLKREQSTARDAIRWLEMQLESGSRFLRAQRPDQSKPLPFLKYPRKAPPHVHNFIQMLEFCNHFLGNENQVQGGDGDSEGYRAKMAPMLVLLVGNDPNTEDEEYKGFSGKGAAKAAGISVEHIEDFYTKWRQSAHKNGKKR
ncbi:hypothetical protein K1T71_009196 [Dendrolimus kikuchii]|uniref:Uncharacterized protein n=1 Tax=Dendrolimus kikuchii TaxID=765133 RepID=A0ACC1CUE0_9NEOP|nr:hypothetical protein K1T71_009196 [Dendrolimus kikuchii]